MRRVWNGSMRTKEYIRDPYQAKRSELLDVVRNKDPDDFIAPDEIDEEFARGKYRVYGDGVYYDPHNKVLLYCDDSNPNDVIYNVYYNVF